MCPSRAAVDRIADQRMTDRGHVDADLVGSPRFEPAFDQRRTPQSLQSLPVRNRALATTAFNDRDLLAVACRTRERSIDCALARPGNAVDDGQVAPVDRVRSGLLRQPVM